MEELDIRPAEDSTRLYLVHDGQSECGAASPASRQWEDPIDHWRLTVGGSRVQQILVPTDRHVLAAIRRNMTTIAVVSQA